MYSNCIDCPNHSIIADPDFNDSFCSDDIAVVCTKSKNISQDNNADNLSMRQEFRIITLACRPYNARKESEKPDWCPLPIIIKKEKINDF